MGRAAGCRGRCNDDPDSGGCVACATYGVVYGEENPWVRWVADRAPALLLNPWTDVLRPRKESSQGVAGRSRSAHPPT